MIGIYKITNLTNNKVYIGQSWNIEKRWKYEKRGKMINDYFSSSLLKHGIDNFLWEVLFLLEGNEKTQVEMDEKERFFIESYRSMDPKKGYNLCEGGGFSTKGYRHTELSKTKIRESHRGKKFSETHRENLSRYLKARPISEETRKKMSESAKKRVQRLGAPGKGQIGFWAGKIGPNKGIVLSEETKKKMSLAHRFHHLPTK